MVTTAKGSGTLQPRTPFGYSMWVAQAQAFGTLAESLLPDEELGLELVHMWDAGMIGSGFTCNATMPALKISSLCRSSSNEDELSFVVL